MFPFAENRRRLAHEPASVRGPYSRDVSSTAQSGSCQRTALAGGVAGAIWGVRQDRAGFAIWREEVGAAASAEPVAPAAEVPVGTVELQRRLVAAETAAAENLARAERAELREQAHQDKWAMEIDRLRQEVLARKSNAAEVRVLSDRVLQLSRELMAARSGIAE
jgi:hypothetical protein